MDGLSLSRRHAMRLAAQLGGGLTLAAGSAGMALAAPAPGDPMLALRVLLALTIPATDTPGANTPENAQFITRALESGLMGVASDTLERLAGLLATRAGQPFEQAPPARQLEVLHALDQESFPSGQRPSGPWVSIKALILMAYFTGEAGASQALRYDIIPGHFDADLPVTPAWRPLANDWSANGIKKAITSS